MGRIKTTFKSFIPPVLGNIYRHLRYSGQTEKPLFNPDPETCSTSSPEGVFYYQSFNSFLGLYGTYFIEEIYEFKSDTDQPLIIDCGANIGVGCRYWKKLYPKSRVIAFEADKDIYDILCRNMEGLPGFEAKPMAVWKQDGSLKFNAVGIEGGHLELNETPVDSPSENKAKQVEIPTFRLKNLLSQKVDLLKMDIEGAELETLRDCKDLLTNVDRIFVEHHSFLGQPQRLAEFFEILESAGFRLNIQPDEPLKSPKPFLNRTIHNNKDGWLNIFGFRE